MSDVHLNLDALHALLTEALAANGAGDRQAQAVAKALTDAEADGQKSHGAARLPSYVAQLHTGKVKGREWPRLHRIAPGGSVIDAREGFAYPAIDMARKALVDGLSQSPVSAAVIRNSHHTGVVAHHVEPLAEDGFIAISMGNGPQAMAPWGGNKGLFGTNPIAFAAPRAGAPPLVIDMSLSKVARGRVALAARNGEPMQEGWAFDSDGQPTTGPQAGLTGTLAPMGDAKGAQLVLMVEVLAGALAAASLGFEASSLLDSEGEPPRSGQFMLAIDPGPFSSGMFASRLEDIIAAIEAQPGTRIPGQRRLVQRETAKREGISLPSALYAEIRALTAQSS